MSRHAEKNPEIRHDPSLPLFEQSFTKFQQAHARHTDPATSKQAAAKITNLGPVRDAIINALYTFGPQTDEGIAAIFHKYYTSIKVSPSGLRSRRAELVDYRLVEDSGDLGKTAMGNPAIIWRLRK